MTAFDPAVMLHAFQIGFPALFAMLNPLGTALVFRTMTSHGTREERVTLARQVALYSLIVMLGSLFSGSYLLSLFGISLEAVRIAGGLMVGMSAWKLLTAPPGADAPSPDTNVALRDLAVVPLTIPLTAGPATISILIAFGSVHASSFTFDTSFVSGIVLASTAAAASVWACYHYADLLARWLGPVGERTATRLVGFLLLCIGIQMLLTGASNVLHQVVDKTRRLDAERAGRHCAPIR